MMNMLNPLAVAETNPAIGFGLAVLAVLLVMVPFLILGRLAAVVRQLEALDKVVRNIDRNLARQVYAQANARESEDAMPG